MLHTCICTHTQYIYTLIDRTENLKKMKETFEEIDQIEHDVALDGSQLSGLKMSLEAAFDNDTKVHVHVITITFYAYAQQMP